ncbi:MAG: hypothetical protein HN793_01475 [Rhodospirillaceae bacterium]|nr:hypothetical protein [Rhodospirillaceae bacterium]MBT5565774.1 hypothetical protein [Rhodospirillaceae bacterium]MBT6088499.1 hypothetical protein [Rhodospirillaceae bacterium]MBT7449470.1 hypothetical protein [Rhodospirillaceae bacterium]
MQDGNRYFLDVCKSWAASLTFEYTTWLALKQEGKWLILYGQRKYLFEELQLNDWTLETDSIRAGFKKTVLKPGIVQQHVNKMLKQPGIFPVIDNTFVANNFANAGDRDGYYEPGSEINVPGTRRFPSLTFNGDGRHGIHYPHEHHLDFELMTADTPFDGFQDLVSAMGLPGRHPTSSDSQKIQFIIAPPLRFIGATLVDGALSVAIFTSSLVDPQKIKLGIRTFKRDSPIIRKSLKGFGSNTCHTVKDGLEYTLSENQEDAIASQLFLSYDGMHCEKLFVNDPGRSINARLDVHRLLDEGDVLSPHTFTAVGDEFAECIALLLQLTSLKILSYGSIAPLRDAPDIVAISDSNDLYLIECTVGEINHKGKLLKLHRRTQELISKLANSDLNFRNIQPIIISQLRRENNRESLVEAGNLRVSVCCREEIEALMQQMAITRTPDEILQTVMALIPTREEKDPELNLRE